MQVLLLKMDKEEDEKGYKKVRFAHFLTYFLARMERKLEQYCKIKFKFAVERFHTKQLLSSHTTSLTPATTSLTPATTSLTPNPSPKGEGSNMPCS